MNNEEIVNTLLKQTNNCVGNAMNLVQDTVEKLEKIDKIGVEKFLNKANEGVDESDGQDYLIVNDKVFDWKKLRNPEVLDEFITMALESMSNEESKNKLKSILLG